VGLMAIPTLIGCFGLLKRRPWARILMIILAILDIAIALAIIKAEAAYWPMIGIALAVYTLWVLLSKEGARLFQTTSAAEPTPHSPQSPIQTTASPAQPSPQTAHARPSPGTANIDKQKETRRRLRVPAIALMIAGIISCFAIPIVIGGIVLLKVVTVPSARPGIALPGAMVGAHSVQPWLGLPGVITLILILVLLTVAGLIITIGASRMLHVRSYGLSVAAAILALLPCYAGFMLGVPFAIWALIVLSGIQVQAAFAKEKQHPTQTKTSPAITLLISLAVVLTILGGVIFLTPAGKHILRSDPTLPGRHLAASKSSKASTDAVDTPPSPLSLMQKSIPTTIANLDFPQGQPDYIAQDPNGPTLTERGALFCNLDPNETKAVTNILQKANARYLDLEKQYTRQSRTDNTLTVIIEPFRDQAKAFLEQLWADIDAALAPEKHAAAHKHLPICPIFGTWRFGQTTMIIEITHKPPFFDYQISYNLDKRYSGPSGRHSYQNRRSLPPEIQQFWQKAQTPPLK
jgi:hypothetical protein